MPEPQPGADRPADGNIPDPQRDRDPAVTNEATPSPVPPGDGPRTGPEGTRELDTDEPPETDRSGDGPQGTRALPADESAETDRSGDGPQGTRALPADEPARSVEQPRAPKWSGSAAVPPPPARKRGWGESADPTPVPPLPEHQEPVDPWAGVDTSGWDLPSTEIPQLPPTLPYPAPQATRPHSGPPAAPPPAAPYPVSPPPVGHHSPPAYPASRPVPTPPAYPAPTPPAYPAPKPPAYPAPKPTAYSAPRPVSPAPAPVPPPVKQKKRRPAPPPATPPGWQAPKQSRRRRRWPWLLLFTLACCCGCPAWFGVPMATQYPAKATLPAEVSDLRLSQDSTQTAKELESQVRAAHWLAEETFAGVYTTSTGKQVTVFGGTGFRFTPESDADAEISRLRDRYALGDAQVVDTDVRGRHDRCAVGRADGTEVVVCTSVDHGSITTAAFTRLSLDDSAALLNELRTQIITPQQG